MSSIKLKHSGGNSVSLNPPTSAPTSSEVAFKLPNQDGSAGQYLKTDGSANLSFSTVAVTTDALTLQAYGSFDLASGATSFANGTQMGPFDTIGNLVGITKSTANGVANSRFTLPSAGVYLIQAKMYAAGNTNPASFGFDIYKNNSIISYSYEDTSGFLGSNGDYIHFNHYIGEFAANDFLDLRGGGNLSSWNDVEAHNRLTICKLGIL